MCFKTILTKIFPTKKESFLPTNKDPYSKKIESINVMELATNFKQMVTPEIEELIQRYDKTYSSPLQTKISLQHTLEIAKLFFSYIDNEISFKINDIIDGNNPYIKLVITPDDGKEKANVNSPNPNNKSLRVFVPICGDLRQLYDLVHELAHTLDTENGDTTTRKILGEVAPQCIERMLDAFLLGMTYEEITKYGFEKSILEKDIYDRKITTFLSRYHNAQSLYSRRGNPVKDTRYVLAQIYSAHFNKFDTESQKSKIKSFISYVQNDDFEGANNAFELQIEKNNKLKRSFYIRDTIDEFRILITPKGGNQDTNPHTKPCEQFFRSF